MIKSFKIRLYPTKEQERLLWKHIGACRFVYNYMLEKQQDLYNAGEKRLSQFDMNNLLVSLKSEVPYNWLCEVSGVSLQKACGDLEAAYQNFFKKKYGFPKFKSRKRSKAIFPIDAAKLWFDKLDFVHIIKIGKVKFKTNFNLPIGTGRKFVNPRVSNVGGKWILSFQMECENQVFQLNDFSMGIDLGIKESAVVAYGDQKLVFPNINKSRKVRLISKRIKHIQRSISRKYESNKRDNKYIKTKNIIREENKLSKLCAHLANIRNNYIHQSTHTLVSLLPQRVVMEDLNVRGMLKNRHLSQAIQEQCFYEWIRQMEYKCKWMGIEFVQVGRFYPSSKTCHSCGCINHNLRLKDRTFVCPECGYVVDRDYNAALNLMCYGG